MQVKLDSPLSFIRHKDLVSFVVEHRNGSNVIVAGGFSQMVKASELEQIIAHNTLKGQAAAPVVKKTSKELMAEAKALKAQEDAQAKEASDSEPSSEEKL